MRKTFIFVLACLLMTGPLLADVCAQGKEKSKPKISFSGDVQYRLRYHYTTKKDTDGEKIEPGEGDYTNRYAWNLKMKAIVSEGFLVSVRLSNPSGYCTDNVADALTWVFGDKGDTLGNGDAGVDVNSHRILSIPEMCFKWNPGVVSLTGGIIPVMTNTILDLVGVEINGYKNAGKCPWSVLMNNSQMGLDLGFNFINDGSTNFGFNVVSTVAADSPKAKPSDALKRDQLRFIFSMPGSFIEKKLILLPMLHLRTNVYRSADLESGNGSLVGGLDIKVNPIEQLCLKAGFAAGGYKNECQEDDAEYTASAPFGLLVLVGTVVKPGYGKAMLDFKLGNWKDRELDPSYNLLHWDIKYAMPIKKLTIMPRVRIWQYTNSETDATTTDLRPELFFIGKF